MLCSEKALKKLGLAFELSDLHEPFFYSKIVILRDSKLLACSFVAVLTIRVSFQESQNTRNQGRDPLGQNFRNLRYKIKWNAQQKVPSSFRKFLGSHRDCSFFQKFAISLFNRNRKISASSVEEEDSLN